MILENLKKLALQLRLQRNPVAASIQFAISEVEKVGKNKGNRETTDDEAFAALKKIIETIKEVKSHITDSEARQQYETQIMFLSSVLPEMATEEQIKEVLNTLTIKDRKTVAAAMKKAFGSRVDMKKVFEYAEV